MPSQTGRQLCRALFGVAVLMLVAGCGTVGFDPAAYQATVQLKYDTLGLIDQSSGRYPPHRVAADALLRPGILMLGIAPRRREPKPPAGAGVIEAAGCCPGFAGTFSTGCNSPRADGPVLRPPMLI